MNILDSLLMDNSLVLTPNARLAKSLQETAQQSLSSNQVLAQPAIYPFSQWVQSLWQYSNFRAGSSYNLLTELESHWLWREAVKSLLPNPLNLDGLVKKIIQAYAFCQRWCLTINRDIFSHNEDTFFFYQCTERYKQLRLHGITNDDLIPTLLAIPPENFRDIFCHKVPSTIYTAFFDDMSPAQNQFLEYIGELFDITISTLDTPIEPISILRTEAEDEYHEIEQAIQWAEHIMTNTSDTAAIVVPDLQNWQDHLLLKLNALFDSSTYNISMGKPLIDYPMTKFAFSLLSMSEEIITNHQLHALLFSNYLKQSPSESKLRHRAYQKIKRSPQSTHPMSEVLNQIGLNSLGLQTISFFNEINKFKEATLEEWSQCFNQALLAIGFPGSHSLPSDEYQIHQKFIHALTVFSALSSHTKKLTKSQAIDCFEFVLNHIIFQPQAPENARLQVLGLIEALGQQFDQLLIIQMSDKRYPSPLSPSPFIPLHIQNQYQLPFASIERENELAEKQLKRLLCSANQIYLSHAQLDQGQHSKINYLCQDIPTGVLPKVNTLTLAHVEPYCASDEVPVPNLMIRGGCSLLKEQALCPFRAFSKFRLSLQERQQDVEGLSPLLRGEIVHAVFEQFWTEIKTQKALIELIDTQKLEKHLLNLISNVLHPFKKMAPSIFTDCFSEMECARLLTVCKTLLEIEVERPAFEVVFIESEREYAIDGLNLKIRIDRIDRLEDDSLVVIDYKTGLSTVSDWFQERIKEPQLPIYALADSEIKGLVFAQLQARNICFKGVVETEKDIPGVVPIQKKAKINWQQQREQWIERLSTLTGEIKKGHIKAQPTSPTICNNCDFIHLCGKV